MTGEGQVHHPRGDPLDSVDPGNGLAPAPSYWSATAGEPPEDDGSLLGEADCDVAIIGGGYTGLSCALNLARDHGVSAVVLEANQVAWGCSGRNGSFARPAIGRLPYARWVETWGERTARQVFAEALAALESLRGMIRDHAIDCEAQPDGWLKIAHRPGRLEALRAERELLKQVFGFEADLLDAERLTVEHLAGGEAFGALRWPLSFAMHPLKLAYGLARAARQGGAKIHTASPVIGWERASGRHELRTSDGLLRARQVVFATNGYTLERLFPRFRARLLPVMSNIVVTQPIPPEEKTDGNFVTTDCLTDTRAMLYYYRRLPDDRVLLGGKGPITGRPEEMEASRRQLLEVIATKFPFFRAPRAEYFWGGWVAISYDSIPHVAAAEDDPSVFYALGYMGSGVAMSCHAGKRLAAALAGKSLALPSPITCALPRFPFAAFRRLGQRAMMRRYAWLDRRG